MNIAVLVYGQYRAAREWFEKNIITLKSMFSEPNTKFDIYILTNKDKYGYYSEELNTYIKDIITKHEMNLKMLEFWEDFQDCHALEDEIRSYIKKLANDKESVKSLGLMEYRRYILSKRFEAISAGTHYDVVVYDRIFDTNKKILRPILPLVKEDIFSETLYFFMDHFFMGSKETMKRFLAFGSTATNYKAMTWTPEFTQEFAKFDCVLAKIKPIFCQETQLFQYILKTFPHWKSIRYDSDAPPDTLNNISAYLTISFERINVIPKRILQIAIGDAYVNSLNLDKIKYDILIQYNTDYEYTLFTDKECRSFLNDFFPQYSSLYTTLENSQYKSDLIRYLYMYKYGGYYIDINILPILPLYTIFEYIKLSSTFFSIGAHTNSRNNTYELCNRFIGTKPGNSIFLDLVKLMENDRNPDDGGMNVKRLYKTVANHHSMTPFSSENSIYLFREVCHMNRYYIVNKKEIIASSI